MKNLLQKRTCLGKGVSKKEVEAAFTDGKIHPVHYHTLSGLLELKSEKEIQEDIEMNVANYHPNALATRFHNGFLRVVRHKSIQQNK